MLGEIGEIQKALKEMNVEMLPKKAKIFYVVVHITEIREYRYVIAAEDKEKAKEYAYAEYNELLNTPIDYVGSDFISDIGKSIEHIEEVDPEEFL